LFKEKESLYYKRLKNRRSEFFCYTTFYMIQFDDVAKIEMTIGLIQSVEEIEESHKMYKLMVDFGEEKPRTILSGIRKLITIEELTGKKAAFVTNLEPRPMLGMESQGMILAASTDEAFSLLEVSQNIPQGTKIL